LGIAKNLYEKGNHLGNVLVTVSDKKLVVQTYCDPALDRNCLPDANGNLPIVGYYYKADVITANDYYPFGMTMPGRKFSSTSGYRYGFNGKENSPEISSDAVSFEARIYESRLGRFLSTDPKEKNYPWQTTYAYFKNCPISVVDVMGQGGGDEPGKHKVKDGETLTSIAKKHSTTVEKLMELNSKIIKNKHHIVAGQTLTIPEFYNPNEVNEQYGIKQEFLKFVDFSGKKLDLGFNSSEVNNFPIDVATSDYSFGPNGSGLNTVAARSNDFFNGTGSTNLVYGPETVFSQAAKGHYIIEKARNFYYSKFGKIWHYADNYKMASSYFSDLSSRSQANVTEYKGAWGIFDAGKTGFASSNALGMQYVGSCSINIFASYDANRLIFVVANSTSNYSWALHIGENISRKSSFGGKPKSTILNLMVWDEPIDYNRLQLKGATYILDLNGY
jgi:RHS repeat-associated protein